MKYLLATSCLLTLLVACTHTKRVGYFYHPTLAIEDTNARLVEAATAISQSLNELKAIEKVSSPPLNRKFLPYPTGYAMRELVSVDWSGPIQPLLQRIANRSGYQLRVIGRLPASPVLVSLTAQNTPLGYILRDADWQAGSQASVFVYPAIRVIELRYAKT